MSLRFWLPLTKDLKNQGLSSIIPTQTSGFTKITAGKLGECYKFTDVFDTLLPLSEWNWTTQSVSFGCWAKISKTELSTLAEVPSYSSTYTTMGGTLLGRDSYGGIAIRWQTNNIYTDSVLNKLYVYTHIRNANSQTNQTSSQEVPFDTWFHIMTVIDRNDSQIKLYLNGELVKSVALTVTGTFATGTFRIAEATWHGGNGNISSGCWQLNDVRVYNHALSPLEVKHIAQGLILHYPLNRGGLGPTNLLKNGFGELGTSNWATPSNISTTDLPPGQSDIKASFINNSTIEHIKIYPSHTYKLSFWIKATATSGYTYPSLFPYDVDGKFIDYYKCPEGFNQSTMTTLKQQLKTGDTKIYVNDLSKWNANSGHYYNWAAIFSYTDGTGYTYPDGQYTQNCARFGSSTNAKTNLDKTNNIITLNSAYTGPTMPAGTKVCASTEGSTYYYPIGNINLATIQDWTYKEGTFSGNHNRIKYAKTVTFFSYSGNRMAGIKIQDLTNEGLDTNIEYDTSGYCNNGIRIGTFNWMVDTPKYQISTYFADGSTSYITASVFMPTDKITTSVWFKGDGSTSGANSYHIPFCLGSGTAEFSVDNAKLYRQGYYINGTRYCDTISGAIVNDGQWHMMTATYDGTTLRRYLDGQLINSRSISGTLNGGTLTLLIGKYYQGGYNNKKVKQSDVRIYATALSAKDIKSLYNNSAYIDNQGNIYGAVYEEV